MDKKKLIGASAAGLISALAIFHVFHYVFFCRYRGVAGKSHCGVCKHRRVCQKFHTRKPV